MTHIGVTIAISSLKITTKGEKIIQSTKSSNFIGHNNKFSSHLHTKSLFTTRWMEPGVINTMRYPPTTGFSFWSAFLFFIFWFCGFVCFLSSSSSFLFLVILRRVARFAQIRPATARTKPRGRLAREIHDRIATKSDQVKDSITIQKRSLLCCLFPERNLKFCFVFSCLICLLFNF